MMFYRKTKCKLDTHPAEIFEKLAKTKQTIFYVLLNR